MRKKIVNNEVLNKYVEGVEKKLMSNETPSTHVNLFNTGYIVDVKKVALIGIKILKMNIKKPQKRFRK
jgi:hypothetical protein